MKHLFYIGCWLIATLSIAQDSTATLSFDAYMSTVQLHHPVALQAQMQQQQGAATLLNARGAFDPKAYTNINQKYFDGSTYFNRMDGGIKIPTLLGIELKGGYEQNDGVYLNPENNTPAAGLWYGGISLPLGQGMFIDERRAALRKASLFKNITEAEQQIMLNNLLYEAGKAYWSWFKTYHTRTVYENAAALAQQRYTAVLQSAFLGDRPAIDTTEAGIQWQNRRLALQQAQLDFDNAAAALSVFLWEEGMIPLALKENTIPIALDSMRAQEVEASYILQLDSLAKNHPEMQRYGYKVDQLEIDRQWKQEQLKPTVNLNYQPISSAANGDPFANYAVNNYKWGVELSMPLFLRKERGAVQLARLKVQSTQLDMRLKEAHLLYKATAALNQWNTSISQVALYAKTVNDYQRLLSGEQQMFNAGESSLFMVNSREVGYINAQVKHIELLTTNRKARLTTGYAFGQLNQQWNN